MKSIAKYSWRVIVATLLLTGISFASSRLLESFADVRPAGVAPAVVLCWLVLSQFLITCVLTYPTIRSRWAGTQLTVAIFVLFFGVHTVVGLTQAVLVVPEMMPLALTAALTAHGFLVAVLFSVVLVFVMGRTQQREFIAESPRLHLPAAEWLAKLAACAVLGALLYLLGQGIVWPKLRAFYVPLGLAPLWQRVMCEVGRTLLLVAFVLPVIKMMRGDRRETALTVAFLFCILCSVAPLLIPSGFMPDSVRFIRLAEGGVTNFLYGLLVGYLFSRQPKEV